MKDLYEVLGVARDASTEEIKKTFRRLARETHPDANPGDPDAEARFREVAEAYEVLSDPNRRASFDSGEQIGGDLFSNFAGLDEILGQFFGGGGGGFGFGGGSRGSPQGNDIALALEISLHDAAFGTSEKVAFVAPVACATCEGSGAAPGHTPARCKNCGGRGQVKVRRDTFLGSMMTVSPCGLCRGRGEVIDEQCETCTGAGRVSDRVVLTVEVPAGVDDGTRLRLTGRGGAGENGAPPGDLHVEMRLMQDSRFERVGADLHHAFRLGFSEATLGTAIRVPLLEGGDLDVDIPPGTQPGTVFRLAKKGVPRLRRHGRGDLLVKVEVVVPHDLTPEQEETLRQYAELRGEQPAAAKKRWRRR